MKFPTEISNDLAEEIGMHVGDGSMNIYSNGSLYSLEGNLIKDKDYFINHVGPLYKRLFNLNLRLRDRKTAGVFGFQINSKGLLEFKSKVIGLPLGPKVNIQIPEMVRKANKSINASFIKGFFDTDGGIYLEHKNNKLYPRVYLTNNSKILLEQINKILKDKFGFNLSFWKHQEAYRTEIKGKDNFRKWMSLIGSNNPRHIKKYDYWLYSKRTIQSAS